MDRLLFVIFLVRGVHVYSSIKIKLIHIWVCEDVSHANKAAEYLSHIVFSRGRPTRLTDLLKDFCYYSMECLMHITFNLSPLS